MSTDTEKNFFDVVLKPPAGGLPTDMAALGVHFAASYFIFNRDPARIGLQINDCIIPIDRRTKAEDLERDIGDVCRGNKPPEDAVLVSKSASANAIALPLKATRTGRLASRALGLVLRCV
jgi:hypothetical protein